MKKIVSLLLTLMCLAISGCSLLNNEIANRRSDREYCTLNEKDATIFTCNGIEYFILEDIVERDILGAWVGYIQKFAVLDEQYAVLELREIELPKSPMSNLPDETSYVVQFFNVYADKDTDSQSLIIDVNGGFHKAIPIEQVNDTIAIISFDGLQRKSDGLISIQSENCTQIIYADKTYIITEIVIGENEFDTYLGFIGARRIFDANTNREIPQGDLGKIEISPGDFSEQVRTTWSYGAVYSINNTDKSKSIAIEINDKYLRADVVQ